MDNLSSALYMVFSVFTLITALSLTLMLFRKAVDVSKYLLDSKRNSNHIYELDIKSLAENGNNNQIPQLLSRREVRLSDIIPVLYRYADESINVKFFDEKGNLISHFYSTLEQQTNKLINAVDNQLTDCEKNIKTKYVSDKNSPLFLNGSPWSTVPYDKQKRVEYFIHNLKKYISTTEMDYEKRGIKSISSTGSGQNNDIKFEEIVVEYDYYGNFTVDKEYANGQTYTNSKLIDTTRGNSTTEIIYRLKK